MKNIKISKFFYILLIFNTALMLLFSCACKPKFTPQHIAKNQQNIVDLMQFMQTNHIDSLKKKDCKREIKKKLRKLKTSYVVCSKSFILYDYPNRITTKDTFYTFNYDGPILGYSELFLIIPTKTKDSLKNALNKTYTKINDTIYYQIWPTLPLM